jgi:hypothetical protein
MKNLKQVSKFKLFSAGISALFVVMLLISCTRNTNDLPAAGNTQVTSASIAPQASTRTSLVAVPFINNVYVPCANGGAGENVALSGETNFVYQLSWNEQGFNLSYHFNHHGVTGVGLSTGETFVGSGGNQTVASGSFVDGKFESISTQQMRVTGQNTSFAMNYKYHITVTPDGNVAVQIIEETVDCKS